MSEEITRKKRIRAGHKASVSKVIGQVKADLDSTDRDALKLQQQRQKLKEKLEILRKLDSEILDLTADENEISAEIEQTDEFNGDLELTILTLDKALDANAATDDTLQIPQGNQITATAGSRTADRAAHNSSPSSQHSDDTTSSRASSPHGAPMTGTTDRARTCKAKLPKINLRKFNGDLTSWSTFWDSFESSIHLNYELSAIDKFNYLNSLLEHSAAEAIAGLSLTSSNYDEAIAVLKKRFGNKQQLIAKHMDVLLHIEPVTSSRNIKGLRQLYDKVESQVRCLKSLGVDSASYGTLLTSILTSKIPHDLSLIISREVPQDEWEFEAILKVIEREVEARERTAESYVPSKHGREYPTAASLLSNNPIQGSCCYCSQSHVSSQCGNVTDAEERKRILMRSGRCFVCLKRNHRAQECRSSLKCLTCGKRHHATICGASSSKGASNPPLPKQQQSTPSPSTPQPQTQKATPTSRSVLSMFVDVRTPVLLQTAKVVVCKPDVPAVTQTTRMIFDTGSQRSYVVALRNILQLPTERTETLIVKTFGSSSGQPQLCDVVNLSMKTRNGANVVIPLLTVPVICEPLSGQPISLAARRYPYLSTLDLADESDPDCVLDVGILIGADHYWALVSGRNCQGDGPTAIETRFGWVLSGPATGLLCGSTSMSLLSCHTLKTGVTLPSGDSSLDQTLKMFWDLESIGIEAKESSVYEEFMQNIKFQNGRYCVRLPWKEHHPPLPDNFSLSQTRLLGLVRRLKQSPHIFKEYDNIIQDQISQGIVEIVSDPWNTSRSNQIHYLPHHGVVREDKSTTKLRVVFDASARTSGPSLNDCLYTGASFKQRIADILVRFCLFPVGLVADIEKAFLMVSIADDDKDVYRFLWLDDIEAELPKIKVLRFSRVVFGVSSSPFLLNATIKHHMDHYRTVDQQFVDKFERSIYVDDLTFSAKDEEDMFQLYKKAKDWLAEGAFNLRKFHTNSPKLQQWIDTEEVKSTVPVSGKLNTTVEDLSYVKSMFGGCQIDSSGVKVLGVQWDSVLDQLSFDIHHIGNAADKVQPTKCNIVGIVSRIYDPLGVLTPFTILFKILFRRLCVEKVDWDQPLMGELLLQWQGLLDSLKRVQTIAIPRCYFNGSGEKESCNLVGFCDASRQAYAAVVYLRIQTTSGCSMRFIAAKSRVAPLQEQTIPRLELLGALLLSRLMVNIASALNSELTLNAPVCYTDSKVVLFWIQRCDKEWRQFVENRIREIRHLISVEAWRHCPGKDNPADLPSRGVDLSVIISDPLWLKGPDFLCDSPIDDNLTLEEAVFNECMSELKAKDRPQLQEAYNFLVMRGPENLINYERFSSLRRLLRTTAYVLKFVKAKKIKTRISREVLNAELDGADLAVAELYCIQACQRVSVHKKKFEEWTKQFGLYLDDANLWRCKGRLSCADLPEATKHPIFLPSGHYFTTLLILDCHQRVMHGGIKETLTELRARFWVVKGRSLVRKVLRQCVRCMRYNGRPYSAPNPPPLPHFWVNASPPFSSIGVDYAGPLYIKGAGNKVWIALFTCCVTHAIHLELIPDMITETFIRCFRRFTCRRGTPTRIVSDNSKTFKAARKELARIQADPIIKDYFAQLRVCWSFSVAKAPWWGGFYERLVGSVKRCLKKVVGNARLTFDELLTVIVEVEGTLNSRLLTYVAADDVQEPLTPAHLLTGYRLLGLPDPHSVLEQDADFVVSGDRSSITTRMEYTRCLLRHFWKRWRSEYLISLRDTTSTPTSLAMARDMPQWGTLY